MTSLEALDLAAANVCRAYMLLGYRCSVMREKGQEVRVIAPQIGAPELSAHLQRVATMIFDGPADVALAGNT